MEESPKRTRFFHRPWVRAMAGFLALVMLFSVAVLALSEVSIQHVDAMQNVTAANNYLVDNNDYIQKNVFVRASDYLSGAVKAPVTLQEHYDFAEALIAREDYKGALHHINACIQLYEGENQALNADLWMKKGCLHALLGEYDQALEGIDHAISVGGPSGDAYLVKAQICLLLEDAQGAMESLGGYLAVNPGDLQAQASMAELYSNMGYYTEAVACYTAVLEHKDSPYYDPALYLGRAGCLLLTGDITGARGDVASYCEQKGATDSSAEFLYGMCCVQEGGYQEALALFEKALEMGHESPALCYEQMAQCYFLLSEFEKTIETGEKALAAKGQASQPSILYRQMGVASMALEQNDAAIEYFSQAIRRAGGMEDHYYRGICYMGKGEFELAMEDFTAALQASPSGWASIQQDCYYYRGMCYLEMDDTEAAILDFEQAAAGEDDETAGLAQDMLDALGA